MASRERDRPPVRIDLTWAEADELYYALKVAQAAVIYADRAGWRRGHLTRIEAKRLAALNAAVERASVSKSVD